MGERLKTPLHGAPLSMKLLYFGPALIFVVIGIAMMLYSFANGESRLKLKNNVEEITIHVVATNEDIALTEEETAEFVELFHNKAIYKVSEKDAPFNNYAIIMHLNENNVLYVSKDRMMLETMGMKYKASPLVDQWKGLKAILQAHDIAL